MNYRGRNVMYAQDALAALALVVASPLAGSTRAATALADACQCTLELVEESPFLAGTCITEACIVLLSSSNGSSGQPGCPPKQACQVQARLELDVAGDPYGCRIFTYANGELMGYAEPIAGGGDSMGGFHEVHCGESMAYRASIAGPQTPPESQTPWHELMPDQLTSVVGFSIRCSP